MGRLLLPSLVLIAWRYAAARLGERSTWCGMLMLALSIGAFCIWHFGLVALLQPIGLAMLAIVTPGRVLARSLGALAQIPEFLASLRAAARFGQALRRRWRPLPTHSIPFGDTVATELQPTTQPTKLTEENTTMSFLSNFTGVITGPVLAAVEKSVVPVALDVIGSQAAAGTISTDVAKIATDVTKGFEDYKTGKLAFSDFTTLIEDLLSGLAALEAKTPPAPAPVA